jgi:hypothetical protein
MSYDAERAIRPELGPGEKLLWSGQPRGGIRLRPQDAFLVPFSLMWGGFAIFWELSVVRTNAPLFFRLWGIPFVLVGLHLIVGRFVADAYARGRTMYGLTNQRVIILSGLTGRQTKSLPLRTLGDICLIEQSDRSGTIMLGPTIGAYGWMAGAGWPMTARYQVPALEMIDNAKSVYDQLRVAQASASAAGT